MSYIHPKALEDLEFDEILRLTAEKTSHPLVREKIASAKPQTDPALVMDDLHRTDEMLRSLQSGNLFPSPPDEPLAPHLKWLDIKESFLEAPVFLLVASMVDTVEEWHRFLKAFGEAYPYWKDYFSLLERHPEVSRTIKQKIDREGRLKDSASEALARVRRAIRDLKWRRDEEFARQRKHYEKAGYLDEIKESFLDGRPVLAVKAAYRRQVKGFFAGTSRSGNVVFIEPAPVHELTRQIRLLEADEHAEEVRILKELTDFLRPYAAVLHTYETFLVEAGFAMAKARLAADMEAVMPRFESERILDLKQAYHPLLLLQNKAKGRPVIPHDIHLDRDQRILVISGPNAGGKSITLKTVGLLQLMWQAGWLVPVHADSRMPFFGKILSDVGDHQSIENELSTYSYRLRNMRLFLRLADTRTLFLIDEFGTGSDPELGGALAEVFLEEFTKTGAFGIITTHYNNLKRKAEELEGVVNAYMEFDLTKMAPTYRLHTGQPGSSFTFEVAARMGIPWPLIRRAQKKVDKAKIKFDRTLSQLQNEKKNLQQEIDRLRHRQEALDNQRRKWEDDHFKLIQKLDRFRQLYEEEQQTMRAGEKIIDLFKHYQRHGDKKKLWQSVMKWADKEWVKREKKQPPVLPGKQKKQIKREVDKALEHKDVQKELVKLKIQRMPYVPKPGDKVRVKGSTANAVLERIEGEKAYLNYGRFTAEVPLHELELVMRKG